MEETKVQAGMSVTRAQAKRDWQAKKPLKVSLNLDLDITGPEWWKQQEEDITLAHPWKLANEKKLLDTQRQVGQGIKSKKVFFTGHNKNMVAMR